MKKSRISRAIAGLSLGVVLVNGVFAPTAWANRSILNQTPEIIEYYFGRPVRQETGKPPLQFNLYSPEGLKRLIPQTTIFAIYFSQDKAKQIVIKFFTPTPYSQTQAAALFNYIFGYKPPMWKQTRRDDLSASYGKPATDFAYCVGNGIANEFTAYGSSVDYVSFKIDSRCKIPEQPGNPRKK